METFRYFTKKGDDYVMKNQKGLNYILGIFCVVVGLILFSLSEKIAVGSIFIILGALCIYCSEAMKMVINPVNHTISFVNVQSKTPKVYSFDDFTGFQMLRMKQYGIFNTNNMLHMQFTEGDGKIKQRMVRQYGLSTKKAQDFTDEIEQIMTMDVI